jgi:hypothetical protein
VPRGEAGARADVREPLRARAVSWGRRALHAFERGGRGVEAGRPIAASIVGRRAA